MIRAVEKVQQRMLRAAQALESADILYAVVDGNAVAAWVSRVDESAARNTRDVDILLRREDLDRANAALERAGFVYRRLASLGRAGTMDVFLDGQTARARDAVHIVFASEKVRDDSPVASPDVAESEAGDKFRLITLEGLIRMKLSAFRDKDRTHLRDMIEVGLIDRPWLERLPEPLAARLKTLLDSPEE